MGVRPARTPSLGSSEGTAGLLSTAVKPDIPPAVAKRIAKAVESSRSHGTRKTYAAAWRRFTGWCARDGHVEMAAHPVTVAAYLVDAADTRSETGERAYAVATFGTWVAAINHQHRTTGHLSPTAHELVTATLSGIRREYAAAGDRPRTPRDPLLVEDIRVLVLTARERSRGWADEVLERRASAILLLGFAGAFREPPETDAEYLEVIQAGTVKNWKRIARIVEVELRPNDIDNPPEGLIAVVTVRPVAPPFWTKHFHAELAKYGLHHGGGSSHYEQTDKFRLSPGIDPHDVDRLTELVDAAIEYANNTFEQTELAAARRALEI